MTRAIESITRAAEPAPTGDVPINRPKDRANNARLGEARRALPDEGGRERPPLIDSRAVDLSTALEPGVTVPAYSVRDVARLFDLGESRLRYWAQTGFLGPSLRRGNKPFYSFSDLIAVRAAKELLDAGVPLQRVRRNLDALRAGLPDESNPLSRLRVASDGDRLVVVADDAAFEPETGQLVLDFTLRSLGEQVARVLPLERKAEPARKDPAKSSVAGDRPLARRTAAADDRPAMTAYDWFLRGCELDEQTDDAGARAAEQAYLHALSLDPQLAAAATNLGNLHHRRGERGPARERFEQALRLDPEQPEARHNLANLLLEAGDVEGAIGQLRRVLFACPELSSAHFNLAQALLLVGGRAQAAAHFRQFLELGTGDETADDSLRSTARARLAEIEPGGTSAA